MAQTMRRPAPRLSASAPNNSPSHSTSIRARVGRKWVMAVSGIVLLGFVVTHMIGNLHLYEGPLEVREYAETLRELGVEIIPRTWLLWGIRIVLILAFVVHVHSAYTLSAMGVQANPRSNRPTPTRSTPEARTSRCQLRQPHHALDRPHHPALPLLPPGRSHVGMALGRLGARRSVQQRRHLDGQRRHRDHLHRRQHRPGRAHLPRHLQPVPEPRHQHAQDQQCRRHIAGGSPD